MWGAIVEITNEESLVVAIGNAERATTSLRQGKAIGDEWQDSKSKNELCIKLKHYFVKGFINKIVFYFKKNELCF